MRSAARWGSLVLFLLPWPASAQTGLDSLPATSDRPRLTQSSAADVQPGLPASLEQDPAGAVGGLVLILPWFFARRDTAALGRFAALYDSLTRRDSVPVTKALRQYGANAARAYGTLAGGDSTIALRAFASLPDSVCVEALDGCRHEKLVLSRLLRAAGEDRKAFEVIVRWTGLDPEVVLERARLAERLGEREMAIKSYRFVTEAWRYADPELQPLVQEARGGLDRVMAESGAGGGR